MKTKITFLKTALLVAVLFATISMDAQAVDGNAVLHVKFEGNLDAVSKLGPVDLARADAGPSAYAAGNTGLGQAVDLSDNAGATQITSDVDVIVAGSGARTLAAWVKGTQKDQVSIMSMGVHASKQRFTMKLLAGTLRAEINGGGLNSDDISVTIPSFDLADDAWHHLAIVYPSGQALTAVEFYVDGILIPHASAHASVPATVGAPFQIGHRDGSEHYTGLIDDVRVYDSALTSAQVGSTKNGAVLGIKDIAFGINELSIYPNSVKDFLNIETTVSEKLEVTVFDMLGKVQSRSYGKRVDMSGLTSGIYIVKVRAGAKVTSLRVIKE